jgi:hypothetical protein
MKDVVSMMIEAETGADAESAMNLVRPQVVS